MSNFSKARKYLTKAEFESKVKDLLNKAELKISDQSNQIMALNITLEKQRREIKELKKREKIIRTALLSATDQAKIAYEQAREKKTKDFERLDLIKSKYVKLVAQLDNDISKNLNQDLSEIINDLLATLQVATSDDTLNSTKYIKKYFEENGDVEYNNELINEYINKEVEKERKKTLDNYWKEHPKEKKELEDKLKKLRTEEINLRSEISNIEKKNEKAIEKIKEKYNIKYEEEQKLDMINKKIDDLKEQLPKLGLFAFSKKSEIKNNINLLEDKLNELNKTLNSKKSEINKKIEKEIELLNKEKEKKVDILNDNLDKQKEIKFQLNIEG